MATKTKRNLSDACVSTSGLSQDKTLRIIDAFLAEIRAALLAGDRVEIRDFGVFEPRRHKARPARNPMTGETMMLPARVVTFFRPSKLMKIAGEPNEA